VTRTDPELLALSASGDREAFSEFAMGHLAAVRAYLQAFTMAAVAEDALQEAFLSAWRHAGSYRGEGSARAWLLAIARNALFRELKPPGGAFQDLVPLDILGAEAGWGAEPFEDPRESLLEQDRVQRALAHLSEADRETLLLKDVEGLRNDEAADLLGIELAAFKSRLHRARLRFLAALGGSSHGH
jgi:RNA polymerase sigma-70 factor (ECF subfamily)